MHRKNSNAWFSALLIFCAVFTSSAWAQNDYGVVDLAEGQVTILTGEQRYTPNVGDVVRENDLLVTGANGELHISTIDQGLIALRPNTRLRIAEYRAEHDKKDKSVLELESGRFRAVTGWIGRERPARYRVRTPTAIIGIRGTDHEPAYVPEGEAAQVKPGTYDKVNEGETYIENKSGRVSVKPNQSGYASLAAAAPIVLSVIPEFYRATQYEQLFQNRGEELKRKYLERPMQIKDEVDRAKEDPRAEAERRAREKIPGGWGAPGW